MTAANVDVVCLGGSPDEISRTRSAFDVVRRPGDRIVDGGGLQELVARGSAKWVLLTRAGDTLEPGALEALTGFAEETGADLVTSDRVEAGRITRSPRWMASLAEQYPYTGRLILASRRVVDRALDEGAGSMTRMTDWEMLVALATVAGRPRHCPVVASVQASPATAPTDVERRTEVVRRFRHARGLADEVRVRSVQGGAGVVRAAASPSGTVSVVVPTAFSAGAAGGGDRVLVERMLTALARERSVSHAVEVVLVVDEETDPAHLDAAAMAFGEEPVVVRTSGPFNFARACNAGILAARGDRILILNDDVEPLEPGWLTELEQVLARQDVVAVGCRLLFEDQRIQHLGVVLGPDRVPMHARIFEPDEDGGPLDRADVPYLAVTGACLLASREDLLAVGGLNEDLPLNFNDVDLCLKLRRTGRDVLCVNDVRMIHRESSTRTPRLTHDELASLARWSAAAAGDPHIEYWG